MENKRIAMVSNQSPLVSVVSLTYNRKEQVGNLLRALRQQDYRPFEVIIVDNASTDGTATFIEAEFPEVRLIQSPENLGNFSYNLGVEAARGVYLLMIDDDGLPAKADWIQQVVARFEANPRLGAVACTVRVQDTGKIAPDSPQFVPQGSLESGYPCVAYNGTGAGLRAAAVTPLIPIYPKPYFRSWIELYLCTRLLEAGWDVRCFPDIEIWHCRPSGCSDPPLAYYGLRNYLWYVLEFYPMPHLMFELLHYLGSRTKLMLQRKIAVDLYLRSFWDAIRDFTDAIGYRTPISPSLVAHLKWVRRHGNWHGIAPAVVPYQEDKLR